MPNEEVVDQSRRRSQNGQGEDLGSPLAENAGPAVAVRFDDQVATVVVQPDATFAQLKTEGITALGLHVAEQNAYRLVVNGEVIGNEGQRVNEHDSGLETIQVRLIKQPTLGREWEIASDGSRIK